MRHIRAMFLRSLLALFAMLASLSAGAQQPGDPATLEAFRAADLRLATIGYRLSTANSALCHRIEPGHGILFHTLDQYAPDWRPGARAHFGFAGPVAVEGVIAGSPAERAGIRQDDTILAVGESRPAPQSNVPASTDRLAAFVAAVATLPADSPLRVELLRDGTTRLATISPVPACRTRYELEINPGLDALANGDMVRISSGYFDRFGSDELVAVAIAHELAHNILRHRDRLKAVGADFGILSGFGRNVRYFRQVELEADILSVHLLARAGYPAGVASRFWEHPAAKAMSGILQSRSHPHWRDRLRVMHAEEAKIAAAGAILPPAPFIAGRDQPLDGNWKPLIPQN